MQQRYSPSHLISQRPRPPAIASGSLKIKNKRSSKHSNKSSVLLKRSSRDIQQAAQSPSLPANDDVDFAKLTNPYELMQPEDENNICVFNSAERDSEAILAEQDGVNLSQENVRRSQPLISEANPTGVVTIRLKQEERASVSSS